MIQTVDCTALVTAIIWRAAQDAESEKKWAGEALGWLGDDGLVLAESIGFDSRVIRRWLADPERARGARKFNLIESLNGVAPAGSVPHTRPNGARAPFYEREGDAACTKK